MSEPLDDGKHTIKAYAKDVVENESEEPDPELIVTIDTAAPEITLNGDIHEDAKYYYGDVSSEPTCTVDDGTDGSVMTANVWSADTVTRSVSILC